MKIVVDANKSAHTFVTWPRSKKPMKTLSHNASCCYGNGPNIQTKTWSDPNQI